MNLRLKERFYKAFHEENALKRVFARKYLFNLFQAAGFHLTADHFYEIVPNTREVARNYSDKPRELVGIQWKFKECEHRALALIARYGAEYPENCGRYGFREENPYFKGFDALMLYLMIRDLKPEKLVEIGQGFSTRVTLSALERNVKDTGRQVEFVSIDPYSRLADWPKPEGVRCRSIHQPLQSVELDPVLEGCGFLFVDSSHVYKFGSDVAQEFAGLYPRLRPGTVFHLHDIYSPYEYPLEWIVHWKRFWNEQYFLECFLMFNEAFEVLLPVQLLIRQSKLMVEAARRLPLASNFHFHGSSLYLRRNAAPANPRSAPSPGG